MLSQVEMEKFRQMFSDYCNSEIKAGHCDEYGCEFCEINKAWVCIFADNFKDED